MMVVRGYKDGRFNMTRRTVRSAKCMPCGFPSLSSSGVSVCVASMHASSMAMAGHESMEQLLVASTPILSCTRSHASPSLYYTPAGLTCSSAVGLLVYTISSSGREGGGRSNRWWMALEALQLAPTVGRASPVSGFPIGRELAAA
jgi:hypothetical protein